MAISKQQFQYLQEMGIPLYVPRATQQEQLASYSQISDGLLNHPIFGDILKAIGLSLGEISVQSDHLCVDTLNWYFSDQGDITLKESQLITPEIAIIAEQPLLKKQLWQSLCEHFDLKGH